jgi:hypothetical protein
VLESVITYDETWIFQYGNEEAVDALEDILFMNGKSENEQVESEGNNDCFL